PQFSLNYESEPGYIENYNSYPYDSSSVPQQYPCCTRCGGPHETCQCDQLIFDEPYCKHCGGPHTNFQCQPMNQNSYNSNSSGFDQPQPPLSPVIHQPPQELSIQEMEDLKLQYLDELKRLKRLNSFYYDDDDEDYTIAVTPSLSIEEPNNSLSMGDEHLDTILATESDEASPSDSELVSSEVMEIVISEVGGIDDVILLTIKDDILREKLLNVNLLIAKIEALNDNPTPSSDCKTKSSSTSFNSLLEETNTFDNSLPEFETFCFDVEEISSGSTTTHSDISLPEYEVFHEDHVKEISSGSPTTHSDSPLYASFIFDLLINPFPPTDRSDFMSSPMNSFTSYLHQIAPYYLLSLRNEDNIFDPGIRNSHFSRPNVSVGNKMHKAFPLPEVCTAIEEKKKKLSVKDRWQLH
nr:hypothetical protein [Tanacetum cinerariifolium]